MKYFLFKILLSISLMAFMSCDVTTYTLRSKKKKQMEMPSLVIMDNIVDFRLIYGYWPASKEELMLKDIKYKSSFEGFKYLNTSFKISDNDKMEFYFWDHIDDVKSHNQSGMVDLNSYQGSVKFYKTGEKFTWKMNMN